MEQDDQQISILAIVLSVCDAGLLFVCCDWRSGALVLMFDVGGGKFVGLGAGHKKTADPWGSGVDLVAGVGFEPTTFRL
ncbi:hypothetical protein A8B75_12535 [Sphingomonadales bacterium EhC05]|nr:hypothetical protein A8B75_12535 [Sphingomonadales bacterium EhC05]